MPNLVYLKLSNPHVLKTHITLIQQLNRNCIHVSNDSSSIKGDIKPQNQMYKYTHTNTQFIAPKTHLLKQTPDP